jgi:molybdate transport system substrate-binding protein
MPNSRQTLTVLITLSALGASILVGTSVQAKSPSICTQVGSVKKVGSSQFRCVKTRSKLTWVAVKPVSADRKLTGNLTVLGAASLTSVLPQLSAAFQRTNSRVKFAFSFGGSSTLAQQITAGAPVDLFFAAGPAPMDTVRVAGDLGGPASNFTSNTLVLAVPRANPAKITGLADLARPGVKFVLCAPQVPCGSAAAKVLSLAGISAHPVSLENDVKGVLTKVAMGEADAGLVYRTDTTSDVISIEFPESSSVVNEYPVAVIRGSKYSIAARAFMDFVLSTAGQAILQKAGFGKP